MHSVHFDPVTCENPPPALSVAWQKGQPGPVVHVPDYVFGTEGDNLVLMANMRGEWVTLRAVRAKSTGFVYITATPSEDDPRLREPFGMEGFELLYRWPDRRGMLLLAGPVRNAA
jgi:hypothetical protein